MDQETGQREMESSLTRKKDAEAVANLTRQAGEGEETRVHDRDKGN